jgi:hypothetical protein
MPFSDGTNFFAKCDKRTFGELAEKILSNHAISDDHECGFCVHKFSLKMQKTIFKYFAMVVPITNTLIFND